MFAVIVPVGPAAIVPEVSEPDLASDGSVIRVGRDLDRHPVVKNRSRYVKSTAAAEDEVDNGGIFPFVFVLQGMLDPLALFLSPGSTHSGGMSQSPSRSAGVELCPDASREGQDSSYGADQVEDCR